MLYNIGTEENPVWTNEKRKDLFYEELLKQVRKINVRYTINSKLNKIIRYRRKLQGYND